MTLKRKLEKALLHFNDETILLIIETDASDNIIAATLSQTGFPRHPLFHTLISTEHKHASIEKESCAIVAAVKTWSQYLSGQKFTIVTDQHVVNFMFHSKRQGKIKNSNGG